MMVTAAAAAPDISIFLQGLFRFQSWQSLDRFLIKTRGRYMISGWR